MDNDLMSRTGLSAQEIGELKRIILSVPGVKDAVVFGSRAKGNFKRFSDIDIALKGDAITREEMLGIMLLLEESTLPYSADIIRYSSITNPALVAHIDCVGISLRTL